MPQNIRVLLTDSEGEPDVERAALPGVTIDSLSLALGRRPQMADILRAVSEQATPVVMIWYGIPFAAETLAALASSGVRGIVCCSVGYDLVDIAAAAAHDITVCHVPDYCTDEVADHTLAMLLWGLRGLPAASPTTVGPDAWWDSKRFVATRRLQGLTLALLGFGRIGQSVAQRAQAFGLKVRWYDPYMRRGQDKVTRTTRVERLADLLDGADALSIHCYRSAETIGMVDAAALAMLAPGAVVVNTARGRVLDEQALLEALCSGHVAAAALDVLAQEPPSLEGIYGAYLRGECPTLLLSPHVAFYSEQSALELRRRAAEEAGRLLRGEKPFNPVL